MRNFTPLLVFVLLLQGCFLPDKDSSTPMESFDQRSDHEQDLYRSELQYSLQSLISALQIPDEISVPVDSISKYPIYEAQINVDISSIRKKIFVIDGDAVVSSCNYGVLIATGFVDVAFSDDCIIVSGGGIEVSHDEDSTLLTEGHLDISHTSGSLIYYSQGSNLRGRNSGAFDYSPFEDEESSVDFQDAFFSQVITSSSSNKNFFK